MTDTPTPEQVAEALKGVTPGPWSIPGQPDKICAEGYTKNGAAKVIATIHTPTWMGGLEPWSNARFIAWARNNIEALAAELAAQKARAEAAEAKVARLVKAGKRVLEPLDEPCRFDHHGYCQAHFVEADCSVAALRAIITEVQG